MVRHTPTPDDLVVITADRATDLDAVKAAVRSAVERRAPINVFAIVDTATVLVGRVVPRRRDVFVGRMNGADAVPLTDAAVQIVARSFRAAFDAAGAPMRG